MLRVFLCLAHVWSVWKHVAATLEGVQLDRRGSRSTRAAPKVTDEYEGVISFSRATSV